MLYLYETSLNLKKTKALPPGSTCRLTADISICFPGSSVGKESACNAGDPGSIPGLGLIPWRMDRLPTPVFLGFPDGSELKNLPVTWETWVQFLGWEHPLEEGMAIHSNILAWRSPMDRGASRVTDPEVAKSQTQLSD